MSRAKFKKILDRDQDELDKIQAILIMVELEIKKEIDRYDSRIETANQAMSKVHVIFSRYQNMVAAESAERRKQNAKKEKRRSDDKSIGAVDRGDEDDASEGTA